MRLTKYAHSCLRMEHDGAVLVVDPGVFSERGGAGRRGRGADHPRAPRPPRPGGAAPRGWTGSRSRSTGPPRSPTSCGDAADGAAPGQPSASRSPPPGSPCGRTAGGTRVIHPDIPVVDNLGYLINDVGLPPGRLVASCPTDARWTRCSRRSTRPGRSSPRSVDFIRAVAPRRAYALHDALLNDNGLGVLDRQYPRCPAPTYQRLEPGQPDRRLTPMPGPSAGAGPAALPHPAGPVRRRPGRRGGRGPPRPATRPPPGRWPGCAGPRWPPGW